MLIAGVYLIDYRGLVRRNLFDYPDALSARLTDRLWDGPLTAGGARIGALVASLAVAAAGVLWAIILARGGRQALAASTSALERPRRASAPIPTPLEQPRA